MLKDKKAFFVSIIITIITFGLFFFVQTIPGIYADSQKNGETTIIYNGNASVESESKDNSKITIPNEKKENTFPKTNEKYEIIMIGIGIILLVTSIYLLGSKNNHS